MVVGNGKAWKCALSSDLHSTKEMQVPFLQTEFLRNHWSTKEKRLMQAFSVSNSSNNFE